MPKVPQLDRFSRLVHECPFVYIRSDSIRILWDHNFPGEKLEFNAVALLKHDPTLEHVKTPEGGEVTPLGVIEVTEKVKYLQRHPPKNMHDRIKYLGSPSNYRFQHFYYLYTRVYGPVSESSLRKRLAEVCHVKDVNMAKFSLPKDLWTCGVKWPEWCQSESNDASSPSRSPTSPVHDNGGSGLSSDDGGDFIKIPDDWEDALPHRSEMPGKGLSSQYLRSPSSRQSKRARRDLDERLGSMGNDWDQGPDRMDVDEDVSERSLSDFTDSRPSTPVHIADSDTVPIDILPKMTARRVLNAILERTSGAPVAGSMSRRDQLDAAKDQTRSVDKRAERLMAHDFFDLTVS